MQEFQQRIWSRLELQKEYQQLIDERHKWLLAEMYADKERGKHGEQ